MDMVPLKQKGVHNVIRIIKSEKKRPNNVNDGTTKENTVKNNAVFGLNRDFLIHF